MSFCLPHHRRKGAVVPRVAARRVVHISPRCHRRDAGGFWGGVFFCRQNNRPKVQGGGALVIANNIAQREALLCDWTTIATKDNARLYASREGTSASASETNATKGIFEEDMTNSRTPETPTSRFRGETTRESIAYRRYLAVYDRTVEFAATKDGGEGKISIEYDIVGHPRLGFRFVAVLPFHSRTKEFTLCREYIQSVNASGLTVPTGGHEPEKHGEDIANAARAEMNEEAQLVGGTLVNLMEKKSENGKDRTVGDEEGFIETKWCRNRFVPFLCVDPQDVEEGEEGKLDVEEFALETFRVSLTELKRIMYSGEMMLPSIITCQMSLDYLVKSGLISRDEYHGC